MSNPLAYKAGLNPYLPRLLPFNVDSGNIRTK
nr:MAG TPA: hypothetical protein [Caudoviricetes sp.]